LEFILKTKILIIISILSTSLFAQSADYKKGQKDGLRIAKMYGYEIKNAKHSSFAAVDKNVMAVRKKSICQRECFNLTNYKPSPDYYAGFLNSCISNI
jgi:hypothetical protein